ncbi:SacI homology domain-containing protein [Aspergillus pseudonomiae]|uniref:phosphoinositide 5-phosphatase n=1 Tax=Aspergillus pseudonomiae TaxID=1506151 RepID=A0A5N7CVM2_9EURO|nr:SacI homology domain-containing protein [Aspergillus pseudonomiae]KAE8398191.1 SacI homology domain-containing protein [Aspergillus pseudonomiae]
MPNLRVFSRDSPQRTLAITTADFALIFKHGSTAPAINKSPNHDPPRCLVEFATLQSVDLRGYRALCDGFGTLGLITLGKEVFLCIVTACSDAATVRPGETVSKIDNVDFFCLSHSDYENGFEYESESFATEEFSRGPSFENKETVTDHPFLALKKLLSDGSFYYSLDFNLTDRLQDRSEKSTAFDIESLDEDMLWNSYMIHPLLLFRSHLSPAEKLRLDSSQILTCVIRGFSGTLTIPASISILPQLRTSYSSTLTIISRQSSRRAGTRFNSRGIDDDGHVANFVETETILWIPPNITFSYVQVRGSVPIFWEQATGFLPGQQKIEITRSSEATRHAFNKHFENLELEYGAIHVVNLLSKLKSGESELSTEFSNQLKKSSLSQKAIPSILSNHALLRATEFDFHAETRGPLGYGASSQIKPELSDSLDGFAYFLSEGIGSATSDENQNEPESSFVILQQEGVFRTNCLDCLDRTNLVQTIISSMALESFMLQRKGRLNPEVQLKHSTLWADNGDALSKIYAGTGALKSSFTRHGKMSIAGALADARKTATRLYVNNFSDKARQKTIDLLLGRLTDQSPVHLYDPINDLVSDELNRRALEYSSTKSIKIWTGSFNVNGRHRGPDVDLAQWLWAGIDGQTEEPTIFAVGFQEIVSLSPQQIMSTDPTTRKVWEVAVGNCLNNRASSRGTAKYVLLRSGQLVGAALMVYVREDALRDIKNVEGSVKKTGLSGMAGNKGGCAIRFEYCNTRICFVTAHLAAGFANYDERNRDYETIYHGLRFQKNRAIENHDAIVWLGDFNYRIGLDNQFVRELVTQKDYQKLYSNDQLNLQMLAGRAFPFYTEGLITFPPTYKYDIDSDIYDTSEKARIPAWCDRILWRGPCLRQMEYNTANLRFSDHRPVWAAFSCVINVVDEAVKDRLRRILYTERRNDPYNVMTKTIEQASPQSEEHILPTPIAPGLPPASSDHHRWWLESGALVKSALKPSSDGYNFNIHHSSNPFSSSSDMSWVNTHGSAKRQPIIKNQDTVSQGSQFPPRPKVQILPVELSTESPSSLDNTINRYTGHLGSEKAAPPIPRKPVSLSSKQRLTGSWPVTSTPQTAAATEHIFKGYNRLGQNIGDKVNTVDTPSASTERLKNTGVSTGFWLDRQEKHGQGKSLHTDPSVGSPPRSTSDDLLDGTADEIIEWKPLIPQ